MPNRRIVPTRLNGGAVGLSDDRKSAQGEGRQEMRILKRLSGHIKNLQLRKKILLFLTLFLLIAFGVTTFSSYSAVNRIMKSELTSFAEISAAQITKNYELIIDELYRLTNMALSDADFRNAIKLGTTTTQQESKSTQRIFQFLSNTYLYRNDLDTVSLYTAAGRKYTQGYTTYVGGYDREEDAWYNRMLNDSKNYFLVLGIRNIEHMVPGYTKPVEVFTVARRIADIDGSVLGVLELNVESQAIYDIFNNVTSESSTQLYLLDTDGAILCRTSNEEPSAVNGDGTLNGDKFLIVSDTLERTGWRVITAIPNSSVFAGVNNALSSFYLLVGLCAAATALMYLVMTNSLTKPLYRLTQGMKKVGEGDFTVSVEPVNRDEIGELTEGFNRMTSQIDSLMKKNVAMEVKEKETEYLVLQSQINPHFLYNTLEAIRMQCISRHENDIASLINTLSNLFRLSISRRERFVKLKDELDHVRSYMTIQNFRFDNKYRLIIDVPEELQEYKTFKLMLQPLVENCVFHGLEMQPGEGHIVISARIEDSRLIITIRDDGVGMTEEQLDNLRAFLAEPSSQPDRQSLGMRTVHERIRLFFGEDCGLHADSREGEGTCITLTMLAFREESEVGLNGGLPFGDR